MHLQKLILFVCRGNIHRSVVAELLARKLLVANGHPDVEVGSRGLQWYMGEPPRHPNLMHYPSAWEGSREALAEREVDVSRHIARRLELEDMERADAVIVMDQELLRDSPTSVLNLFPSYGEKTHLFSELIDKIQDVEDRGEYASTSEYRAAVEEIESTLVSGLPRLLLWVGEGVP
ncbi:hypothetical protein HYW18_01060 [Candidatus Uhrbacteria bacterium]|nr:hypothetical protein [Candidatus Uhrbacteria bacterium]